MTAILNNGQVELLRQLTEVFHMPPVFWGFRKIKGQLDVFYFQLPASWPSFLVLHFSSPFVCAVITIPPLLLNCLLAAN